LESLFIRLAVNQDKVGTDMTVTVVLPFSGKWMVMMTRFKRLIRCQGKDDHSQASLERGFVLTLKFAF